MIYTSYFAKLEKIPKNIIPVSICLKTPTWYSGFEYKKLAPTYSLLKHWKQNKNEEYYKETFKKEVLNKLSILEVLKELSAISSGDIVLLCYEKSDSFCHRHLVRAWLESNGIESCEWTNNSKEIS